ncbi:FMN reductase (NADPH) [Paenibacillus oryzae]|uniref:FMN reductase (NADPH) n=1 Tax=Paenibacillus oryzae TaxID=1844972 RepID=A0A1A5YAH3_9BACL|nr:NADPH-dependent FMN reductase [Paenibacillus oryzae]OBR62568.1 FMN reductase (NADPH) [Paenibacillus oryzae]
MAKIVIVSGTPNRNSRLYGLIHYSEAKLREYGHEVSFIHVAELPPEDLIRANFGSPEIKAAQGLVAEADAVIVASPVYKASYTGILKTFLDLVPERGLHGKLSLPLFIGGTIAHLLAVDYSLKPVLTALGARHIMGGVYATDQLVDRLPEGGYKLAEEITIRLDASLEQLNEELHWQAVRNSQV